ncbi:hypothetical protein B0J14DRAFT_596650 [Halenospora varia]|nr:hypothetical protein B0J14DRAFT_596650 [Halenospora varia]
MRLTILLNLLMLAVFANAYACSNGVKACGSSTSSVSCCGICKACADGVCVTVACEYSILHENCPFSKAGENSSPRAF